MEEDLFQTYWTEDHFIRLRYFEILSLGNSSFKKKKKMYLFIYLFECQNYRTHTHTHSYVPSTGSLPKRLQQQKPAAMTSFQSPLQEQTWAIPCCFPRDIANLEVEKLGLQPALIRDADAGWGFALFTTGLTPKL